KKEQSLFRKLTKNKLAAFGLVIILLLTLTAIFAPLLAPFHPNKMDVTKSLLGAGEEGHLLGTDNYGRDILSRVIYGSRISLIVGVSAVLLGLFSEHCLVSFQVISVDSSILSSCVLWTDFLPFRSSCLPLH